jgi:hypothetical protein
VDADNLGGEPVTRRLGAGDRLRRAADLEIDRVPSGRRVHDIDHERHARASLDVAELLRGAHPHATDVDRVIGTEEIGHRRVADHTIG